MSTLQSITPSHERTHPQTDLGLRLSDVCVQIPLPGNPRRWVHAARGLRLHAPPGMVTAIVGESGCGKSVLGLAATGLLPAGTRVAGSIEIGDRPANVLAMPEPEIVGVRGQGIGLVPQSASTHLNPVRTVGGTLTESLRHHGLPHDHIEICALLQRVGLTSDVADTYPHELSGGMAQRALVAMTMALRPGVLIADEPTSALDHVSGQIVLDMLRAHANSGHAVVLITHDLTAARTIADQVAVMYAGEFLEVGPTAIVLHEPRHDYSRALLAALPEHGLVPPPGTPSSLIDPDPTVCAWHARTGVPCEHRPLSSVTSHGRLSSEASEHWVACLREETA